MFFRGKERVMAMYEALSRAILPEGFEVEELGELERFYLEQSGRKQAKIVEDNSEVLASEVSSDKFLKLNVFY